MTNRQSQAIILKSYPHGAPSSDNFELAVRDVPELSKGDVLVRSIYLTVDPYMRGRLRPGPSYAEPQEVGDVMVGEVAGVVEESRSNAFSVGDYVTAHLGWQTCAVARAHALLKVEPSRIPLSAYLGVVGMPGFTAYFGTCDVLRPRAGDTLVVNAASGAVGSVVGQIALISGCRVVGIAGSEEKCAWITEELGFHAAINHRNVDNMRAALRDHCPDGIDCYFDNVGGEISDAAFENMALGARVAICGQISQYNDTVEAMGPRNLRHFLVKRATLRGLLVFDWRDRYPEARARLTRWIDDGKIKYREDIVNGLENAPAAFAGLMEGRNFGKQIVQLSHDPLR